MATTVAQHAQANFATPVNGAVNDASIVLGNDNNLATQLTAHDADGGIHFQSGLHSARPIAATAGAGAKWLSTDTDRVYHSDGAAWTELAYILSGDTVAALDVTALTADTVVATSFDGDGSALTALPASELTGTASALTITTLTADTVQGSTSGDRGVLTINGNAANILTAHATVDYVTASGPTLGAPASVYLKVVIGGVDYLIECLGSHA